MKRYLILFTLITLFLVGCSPAITTGRVVDKEYIPAHTSVMLMPMGKSLMPMTQYISDAWEITIEGENEKGEQTQRTTGVTEKQYNQIKIGQEIDINTLK